MGDLEEDDDDEDEVEEEEVEVTSLLPPNNSTMSPAPLPEATAAIISPNVAAPRLPPSLLPLPMTSLLLELMSHAKYSLTKATSFITCWDAIFFLRSSSSFSGEDDDDDGVAGWSCRPIMEREDCRCGC